MQETFEELDAMKKVAEAIGGLEPDAQKRVIHWAEAHFSIERMNETKTGNSENPVINESLLSNSENIDSIGELFALSLPSSDAEKALVAGYWLQIEQGSSDFTTQEVNSDLKHLGYGIGNITRAFETLKKTRPQQVIQLRKAGTSKQARKTFKLTDVGKKVVESMIQNRSEH